MNNLFWITLNPKDNATDLNGYITNVLSRFLDGEKFNVPRFIWVELAYAMDDGRRSLPYVPYLIPYLMFMIERVTGQRFPKDCFHIVYNIKKTHGGRRGSGTTAYHSSGGTSFAHRDILEFFGSGGKRKNKKFAKMAEWLKAIFTTCTYAANTAYENRLESWDAIRQARELAGLLLLSPIWSPPQFPNLPRLSNTSLEDEEQQGSDDDGGGDEGIRAAEADLDVQETLLCVYSRRPRDSQATAPSTSAPPRRSARFTSTTHIAGRARIEETDSDEE
jgi:hypothetical protein